MRLILLLLLVLMLTACAGEQAADPADTVERYLTAKVTADEEGVRSLLCSELEAEASREATSFAAVEARLEEMECTRDGDNRVACTGSIVATYGTEDTEFPLGAYRVVQEDGEWKWCGETG